MEYTLIRSDRKTLQLQVTPEGIVVRAPKKMPQKEIKAFVNAHAGWIEKHAALVREKTAALAQVRPLTPEELRALADRALQVIPPRVAYWADKMGVSYGRITIRNQRTKWGSCTAAGNLNFNCLLLLAPPQALDSVIVHELAHRKEMNHSARFYAVVRAAFPEYDEWNRWLKQNGPALMARQTS